MSAFGKAPPSGAMGTFRQTARAHQALRPKSGGGGKPSFLDQFKPSTEEPDNIRIIRGAYEVELALPDCTLIKQTLCYYPYVEHFHGTLRKGSVCSGGPLHSLRDKREPCIGCDLFYSGRGERGAPKGPMSKREMFSFSVLHYATFAKLDQIDRETGAVRTNSEGKAYSDWVRVPHHERNLPKFAGKETREASLLHWDMGFDHQNTLTEMDKLIGKSCKSCGGRDTVRMDAWVCNNPQCGAPLIEASSTTMSPKEIEEVSNGEVRCASCQSVGMMTEYVSCSNCNAGARAEIFDVDLGVQRFADPRGGQRTTLSVTSWSNPRPIDARFVEMAKPLDLARTFAPTPYEQQAEKFKVGGDSARQPVTAADHSRPYRGRTLGG